MEISKKIKQLRESAHWTQQELAERLSISRSTLAGYESESKQPSYQVLAQIANVFKVPTDYILGVGVFENWEFLLENKAAIVKQISIMATRLSQNILNGIDDISFARLAYAFDVHVNPNLDDGTVGIIATDPIPTISNDFFPDIESLNPEEKKLLSIFRNLTEDDRIILYGKALDLKRTSVADDVCFENKSGKSLPSNGTEGDTMAG